MQSLWGLIRLTAWSLSIRLYTNFLSEVISSYSFSYPCYVDNTQLILCFPPSDTNVSAHISACLADILSWMTALHLKLTPSKTELLYIPGVAFPCQNYVMSLKNAWITPPDSASDYAIVLDNQSISPHIAKPQSYRLLLYTIKRILPWRPLSWLVSHLPSWDWSNSCSWFFFTCMPFDLCNWCKIKVYNLFTSSLSPPTPSP